MKEWTINIKGGPNEDSWEISVIRSTNRHGKDSYGWFDDDKLLVGHDGGPCHDPVCKFVWVRLCKTARELCDHLNSGGRL